MDSHENDEDNKSNMYGRRNPNNPAVGHQNDKPAENDNVNPSSSTNDQGTIPKTFAGFTMVTPNETRRSKLKMTAQKGVEDLQKLRESQRAVPVHVTPEKLGGDVSLDAARERQAVQLRQAKTLKKMKREESDRKKRDEEEEALQEMKAQQREKAERLEEKKRQQEQLRSQQLRPEQVRARERFLQNLQQKASFPMSSNSKAQTSSPCDVLHDPRERELGSGRALDHTMSRVNSAFLDRLDGRGRGAEGVERGESHCPEPQQSSAHLTPPGPPQRPDGWADQAGELVTVPGVTSYGTEPDYEWAVMKLETRFPDCARAFLEDILAQCNGDYQQASTLLCETMS